MTFFIFNESTLELLLLTLSSACFNFAYFFWIPWSTRLGPLVNLFFQFLFIILPQALIIVFPSLISVLYLSYPLLALLGLLSNLFLQSFRTNSIDIEAQIIQKLTKSDGPFPNIKKKENSISMYQSNIMTMTITAILASDFSFFPKRFYKSRTYGISLMDVGVILIVFSSGLVWGKYMSSKRRIKLASLLRSTIILGCLGVTRAILGSMSFLKNEYGKHWNFFLTLAILPYSLLKFHYLFQFLVYEYFLHQRGLQQYLLTPNPGGNFLQANKEGIYGLIGYSVLFLVSCYIGKIFRKRTKYPRSIIFFFAGMSIASWLFYLKFSAVYPPSRRLVNLSFVVWGLANGSVHCFFLALFDHIWDPEKRFILINDIISEYRLSLFFLANIIVGLIKLAKVPTKSLSRIAGSSIIVCYLFLLLGTISLLYYDQAHKRMRQRIFPIF